jgi:hypothetical protein
MTHIIMQPNILIHSTAPHFKDKQGRDANGCVKKITEKSGCLAHSKLRDISEEIV